MHSSVCDIHYVCALCKQPVQGGLHLTLKFIFTFAIKDCSILHYVSSVYIKKHKILGLYLNQEASTALWINWLLATSFLHDDTDVAPGVNIAVKGWLTLGTKLWKSAEPEMQFLPEKPSLDRIHCSSLWPSRSNSSTGAFSTCKRGGQLKKMADVPFKMWMQGSK